MKKSLFRVKYYLYMALAGSLALLHSDYGAVTPETQFLLFTVPMMILGYLGITLKCECCGSRLFDLKAGKPREAFRQLFSLKTYFLPSRCAKCGCERY